MVTGLSLLLALVSLLLTPLAVARLPADYLTVRNTRLRDRLREGGPRAVARFALRNLLALALLVPGLLMLFTPGQGLLTIAVALVVADFPGRRRLVRALLRRPLLARAVQALRARAGVPPLLGVPHPPTDSR